jgi:hypothetical protein
VCGIPISSKPHKSPSLLISSLVTIVTIITIAIIAIMASDSEAALSVKVSRFLADKNTNPEDRLALIEFLDASPEYSKPTSYISDIEQRLQLLREIQQKCAKHLFDLESTAALWSALMVAPLERLRYYCDVNTDGLWSMLNMIAMNMPMLLKVCMLYYQFTLLILTSGSPCKEPISRGTNTCACINKAKAFFGTQPGFFFSCR